MAGPWVGVDVGGRRKGFDVAVLDEDLGVELRKFDGDDAVVAAADAIAWLQPAIVAIDAPNSWAEPGQGSRTCERVFASERICGIRYTPAEETAESLRRTYYGWIDHGLELWDALRQRDVATIECFPTASWTRWFGPRGTRSRAAWSSDAMLELTNGRVQFARWPANQDQRDAVAAAFTAYQSERGGAVDAFGTLTVPASGSRPLTLPSDTAAGHRGDDGGAGQGQQADQRADDPAGAGGHEQDARRWRTPIIPVRPRVR